MAFENGIFSTQKIKAKFLNNLWIWANLYSVDNTNSLLDFLTWLGVGRVFLTCFLFLPFGSLLYTSSVLFGTFGFFFDLYIAFY